MKAVSILILLGLTSCQESITEYATAWTYEVKKKIMEDASLIPDRTTFDSTTGEFTSYKGDVKLKYFKLGVDANGILFPSDTVVSIQYSTDQNFELVKEHCPAVTRSFEGIRYIGEFVGLTELKYCNGSIKERGFRFLGNIGVGQSMILQVM